MLRSVAKLFGYTMAPKATFMMRHPIKGARLWRASRRSPDMRVLTGTSAAVMAVPVGFWLASRRK